MLVSNDTIEYYLSYDNGYTSTYDYAVYDIIIIYKDDSETEFSTSNATEETTTTIEA